MEDNRFKLSGVLVQIDDTRIFSAFFRKRECKIRFTDTDFTGKLIERKVKVGFVNDDCELLDKARIDDVVQISFYIDGRDVVKEDKDLNFTSIVGYEIIVLNSVSRTTEESKDAIITADGLLYNDAPKEVTIEDMMKPPEPQPIKQPISDDKNNIKNEFDDLPF